VSESILIASLDEVKLEPAPINPQWILSGKPQASGKLIAKSKDKTGSKFVWECTPGQFEWHYNDDETVHMISGEVFLLMKDGTERRLGAGDMAFFPAGSSCTWRVTAPVRKFAIVRQTLPYPFGLIVRAVNKITRLVKPASQL